MLCIVLFFNVKKHLAWYISAALHFCIVVENWRSFVLLEGTFNDVFSFLQVFAFFIEYEFWRQLHYSLLRLWSHVVSAAPLKVFPELVSNRGNLALQSVIFF